MAVRRKGDRWQVEFAQAGVRILRRLPPAATKEQAQALETKLRRDIFDRVSLGKQNEITLEEAIAAWLQNVVPHQKDQRKPGQNALLLAPFVGKRLLREVVEVAREVTQVWGAAKDMQRSAVASVVSNTAKVPPRAQLAPATINRRLSVLKAASKYAWQQGWIAENLSWRIKLLPEHNRREVYLTAAQVKRLASFAPSCPCRTAIYIAAYSGLRVSELLALPATTSRSLTLLVPTSKTGKPRLVPIAGPVRPYLSALPLGLSYRQLIGQFWVARKAAGMPHVRFHDLRHSCASMLINAGVDLYTVGKILGHSSTQTTARYAHLADATLQKAMRKLR